MQERREFLKLATMLGLVAFSTNLMASSSKNVKMPKRILVNKHFERKAK